MELANSILASLPCRLSLGFGGESLANFQLVDRNPALADANVEKYLHNVNKSVGNGEKATI
jgi:hypothetical protein